MGFVGLCHHPSDHARNTAWLIDFQISRKKWWPRGTRGRLSNGFAVRLSVAADSQPVNASTMHARLIRSCSRRSERADVDGSARSPGKLLRRCEGFTPGWPDAVPDRSDG